MSHTVSNGHYFPFSSSLTSLAHRTPSLELLTKAPSVNPAEAAQCAIASEMRARGVAEGKRSHWLLPHVMVMPPVGTQIPNNEGSPLGIQELLLANSPSHC